MRLYAPIYRRHVSDADTLALAEFFQSPLGSRYLSASGRITQDTDMAARAWSVSIANYMLRENDAPIATDDAAPNAIPQHSESEQTRAVRELIRVSGARTRAQAISAEIVSRLSDSHLDDVLVRRARQRLSTGDALVESWVPAYARHLTTEDTRAMITFFRSPVGRRWVEALPRIQKECLLVASSFAKDASRSAVREVLGPLPEWRLLHPGSTQPGTVPDK